MGSLDLDMDLGLWRLTRNPYGRRVYEALARAGVTATRMYEYVARLDGALPTRETPARVVADPDRTGGHDDYADLAPDERAVVARVDGREVGHLFLSVDTERRVAPLETRLAFEGGYVRRVWVDPAHRKRGVATAMVAAATRVAREAGADRVAALVAVDNRPSQLVFEANGFGRERIYTYARVGPFDYRTVERAEG